MAMNYAYNYAYIDPETNMCIGFQSTTSQEPTSATVIEVPVDDPEYIGKFYIDGNWYEDPAGTIPWQSELL